MITVKRLCVVFVAVTLTGATTQETMTRVRAWRVEHEKPILLELFDFLSIPNVAANARDIQRNAEALTRMFEHRRFAPEIVPTGGAPLVIAERRMPNVQRTLTFYFHYDGQPVIPSEWSQADPFVPVVRRFHDQGLDRVIRNALGAVVAVRELVHVGPEL